MTKTMATMLAKAIKNGSVVAAVREKRVVAEKLVDVALLSEERPGVFRPTDKAYADAGLTPPRVCHLAGEVNGTRCGQRPAPTSHEPVAAAEDIASLVQDFGVEPCALCVAPPA